MCGVLGGFGEVEAFFDEQIDSALTAIDHRGPDAQGKERGSFFFLGHKRLSILDLSEKANQPFSGDKISLVYNGEIYNHNLLRESLQVDFKTSSDTETLYRGLSIEGASFLKDCHGMFAGGYVDKDSGELFLFRDRLGIKPLYYTVLNDSLYFSSEIKALLALGVVDPKVDKKSLRQYVAYENYAQELSLFSNISMLKPGQMLRAQYKGKKLQYNFEEIPSQKFDFDQKYFAKENIVSSGREIIEDTIKSHLLSDVPLGVYLSGGIDSSLVATIASRHSENILAFTGYFSTQNNYYDERDLARRVARKNNITLHEVEINAEMFRTHFDEVIYALDEPRMGMGSFSQYMVAKELAQHRKVVLTGHGGDELFAGYPMFKAFHAMQEGRGVASILSTIKNLKPKEYAWLAFFFYKLKRDKTVCFAPEILNSGKIKLKENPFISMQKNPSLTDLFKYYKEVYLPGLLVIEDKISMAHSLESRVPLWSDRLIEWSSQVSIEDKLKGGKLKNLLLEIAKPYLPQEVIDGPKKGFPTPLRYWFRSELFDFVNERLCTKNDFLDTIIPYTERTQIVSRHRKYPLSHSFDELRAHKIWILLCLESWQRQFKVGEVS